MGTGHGVGTRAERPAALADLDVEVSVDEVFDTFTENSPEEVIELGAEVDVRTADEVHDRAFDGFVSNGEDGSATDGDRIESTGGDGRPEADVPSMDELFAGD